MIHWVIHGPIAPAKLLAGIFLQENWQMSQSWDGELPQEMIDRWNPCCAQLAALENLQIARPFKPLEEALMIIKDSPDHRRCHAAYFLRRFREGFRCRCLPEKIM